MAESTWYIKNDQIRKNFLAEFQKLPDNEYMVEIKRIGKTIPQRNYWHTIIRMLAKFTGYTEYQTKYMIKEKVLGVEEWTGKNGKKYATVPDSESLNKDEYNRLIDLTLLSAMKIDCPITPKSYFGVE